MTKNISPLITLKTNSIDTYYTAYIHGYKSAIKDLEDFVENSFNDDSTINVCTEVKQTTSAMKSCAKGSRQKWFSWEQLGIGDGEYLTFVGNPKIKVKVCKLRSVEYQGKIYSISPLTKVLADDHGSRYAINWKYNGQTLKDLQDKVFASNVGHLPAREDS